MKIDFYTDLSCPFCYVIELGLEALKDELEFYLDYKVIRLAPEIVEKQDIFKRYPQAVEVIPRLNQMISYSNRKFEYRYKYNTEPSTRLIYAAKRHDAEHGTHYTGKLVAEISELGFEHGADIGDVKLINKLAAKRGIAPELLAQTECDMEAVLTRAKALGVHSTPCLIINDRHVISGSQPLGDLRRQLMACKQASH